MKKGGVQMAEPKNNKERNRRLWLASAVIALISIAYYTDRFGPGAYTGDWKIYAYIVGIIFAIGAGYLTVTHVLDRLIDRKK